MALVHSDRIARNPTIRKFNTLLRLENETIRPDIPLLLGLTIQNPQTPPLYPPRPSRPSFMATPYTLYKGFREKIVSIKTHKTAMNRPVDHTGEM